MDHRKIKDLHNATGKILEYSKNKKCLSEIFGAMEQKGVKAQICIVLTKEETETSHKMPNNVVFQFPNGQPIADTMLLQSIMQQFGGEEMEEKNVEKQIKHEHLKVDQQTVCVILSIAKDYYEKQILTLEQSII